MNWRSYKLVFLSGIFGVCLTHCSKSADQTNAVPTPPSDPTPAAQPVTPPTAEPDSRLPSWVSKAVPIQLTTAGDFSGLQDLFGIVYPPLVGDPSIAMDLTGDRERTVSGTLHFGFEDAKGFQYIDIPSVVSPDYRNPNGFAGYRDTNYFDGYFSDDSGVVRIVGSLSNNTLTGKLYYRIRLPGEVACQEFVQCNFDPHVWQYDCQKVVDILVCRNYMDASQSQSVKQLGTFAAPYLNWFTK